MTKVFADVAGSTTANDGLGLDKWMQRLVARCAGATDAIIRAELLDAVREFYKESNAWREQIGPYHVYAGSDLVWLNPVDSYSEVIYVRNAWLEGPSFGQTQLRLYGGRHTDASTGSPSGYSLADPYVIRLYPTPDVDLGPVLWADATLCPTVDTTRVPQIALSHHFDAILEGAMARLTAMPNKPWTDLAYSMRLAQLFRRKCIQFRAQSQQGYATADPGWRYPRWT